MLISDTVKPRGFGTNRLGRYTRAVTEYLPSTRYYRLFRGRDSSVGIATRYGLDGLGIESRCGARFSVPVQTSPGTHPASYTMGK